VREGIFPPIFFPACVKPGGGFWADADPWALTVPRNVATALFPRRRGKILLGAPTPPAGGGPVLCLVEGCSLNNPHLPAAAAGKCMAIGPDTVSGGGSRISVKGVHVDCRGVVSSLAVYQGRIAPAGVGGKELSPARLGQNSPFCHEHVTPPPHP